MTQNNKKKLAELFLALDDGEPVAITFDDGAKHDLKVVSTTHVDIDETVMAVPVNDDGSDNLQEHGIQFSLDEVREVRGLSSRHVLFKAG